MKRLLSLVLTAALLAGFAAMLPAALANAALPGDVDGNGVINAADVTMLRRYIAAGNDSAGLAGFNLTNANVKGSGTIDAADVTLLRRYLAATDPSLVILGPRPPLVALTFDDGPNATYTVPILNYFRTLNTASDVTSGQRPPVHATFYITGDAIHWLPGATMDLLRRTVAEGHAIDGHSAVHGHMGNQSRQTAASEINWAINLVGPQTIQVPGHGSLASVGVRPWSFRPPYFDTGPSMAGLDVELRAPFIMSGVDPDDWRGGHSSQIMANFILHGQLALGNPLGCACSEWGCSIRTSVDPHGNPYRGALGENNRGAHGANILMHDGGGDRTRTVAALPLFIPQMRDVGYEFVTVEEIYKRQNITPCRFTASWNHIQWNQGGGWALTWPNNFNRIRWQGQNRVNDWARAGAPCSFRAPTCNKPEETRCWPGCLPVVRCDPVCGTFVWPVG
jgi:peptidoglycan/xylan/chitin deacetylase (PgdA/CDA1 family)